MYPWPGQRAGKSADAARVECSIPAPRPRCGSGPWGTPMRRILKPLAVAVVVLAAAACEGTWTTASSPSPVRAIHAALMHTGKVLLIAGSGNDRTDFAAGTFKTAIYDPATDTFKSDISTPYDLFCGGHAFLPDGRLLVVGGTAQFEDQGKGLPWNGEKRTTIFDPVTETYQPGPDMAIGRRSSRTRSGTNG